MSVTKLHLLTLETFFFCPLIHNRCNCRSVGVQDLAQQRLNYKTDSNIILKHKYGFQPEIAIRVCNATSVCHHIGSVNMLVLWLYSYRQSLHCFSSVHILTSEQQSNMPSDAISVELTLPGQWSLITISQYNHSFHPMFPTDHCRLVSIFRRKVILK